MNLCWYCDRKRSDLIQITYIEGMSNPNSWRTKSNLSNRGGIYYTEFEVKMLICFPLSSVRAIKFKASPSGGLAEE